MQKNEVWNVSDMQQKRLLRRCYQGGIVRIRPEESFVVFFVGSRLGWWFACGLILW